MRGMVAASSRPLTADGGRCKKSPNPMASEKAKTGIIIGVVALAAVLVLGGILFAVLKMRAQAAERRALARLKEENPVEYYVLHTPLTQSEEQLKNLMAGKWELAGNKSQGQFYSAPAGNNYFKIFTPTNWAVIKYDADSNVVSSAGGTYTLRGDVYTESIELATGPMKRYLGAHPTFRIRVDGDCYYQMGAGRNPSIEEKWRRVEQ